MGSQNARRLICNPVTVFPGDIDKIIVVIRIEVFYVGKNPCNDIEIPFVRRFTIKQDIFPRIYFTITTIHDFNGILPEVIKTVSGIAFREHASSVTKDPDGR